MLLIKTFQILPKKTYYQFSDFTKFYQKETYYQIFLKIHEILPKVKLFTKSGHTGTKYGPLRCFTNKTFRRFRLQAAATNKGYTKKKFKKVKKSLKS